jgi:protein-disulfide isomerase
MSKKLNPPVNKKDHVQGSSNALIELLEFGDFQCPHCGAAYPIIKEIQKASGKKLKFVFRNFPLSEAHPMALPAAIAAEAAGKQNQFWEMHDVIFENQMALSKTAVFKFAKMLSLNIPSFEKDLQDKSLAEKIEADFESGIKSGVNGTPSFFINGYKYEGSYDFDSLMQGLHVAVS